MKKFKEDKYELLSKTMNDDVINYFLKELNKIRKQINIKMTFGEAFEIFSASSISGKNYKKASKENTLIGKKGDGGIDAYFFNSEEKKLTLIQTKFEDYDEKFILKMMETYETYIKLFNVELPHNYRDIKRIRKEFMNEDIEQVEYIFIGTSEWSKQKLSSRFPGKNVCVFTISEFLTATTTDDFRENYISQFKLMLHQKMDVIGGGSSKSDSWFIYVNGHNLIKQFSSLNSFAFDSMFEENIRNKVVKTKFYNEFKDTILKAPDNFHLYNNGLTIVAKNVEPLKGFLKLHHPQIINGQQTVRTLMKLFQQGVDLTEIDVPIKVIKTSDKEVIKKIARYSNNQTAVKEAELNFIDEKYKKLSKLANKNGYHLIGKRGTTSKGDILKISTTNGNLPLNELVRSHAAYKFPKEYLGKSKSSIPTVVKEYFGEKNYIQQLLKEKTFEGVIKTVQNYKKYYDLKFMEQKQKSILEGNKAKDANKVAIEKNKHLKFGISVFYNLQHRNKDEDFIDKCIYKITENNGGTINVFKNNSSIVEALKIEKDRLEKNN
ncbi:AIPR family protein [Mycoplasma marinum]|uniref:Abortive phage infection protein C-terminal domain-containing protein n=1 Tax=Mycoplasma marinum TaxID=1937190 RepID=A0A4R0XP86_9MOLU|nr:AIPR family protein [Mycoplasma marinum]TCG11332.1 hypothetical protein C4B24_02155 [Mycoplasma marinum]